MPAPGIHGWREHEEVHPTILKILPRHILLLGLAAWLAVGIIDFHYKSKVYTPTISALQFLVQVPSQMQLGVASDVSFHLLICNIITFMADWEAI
jgi:hypothetical protein